MEAIEQIQNASNAILTPTEELVCKNSTNKSFASFSFFTTFIIFVSCKFFHFALQHIRQPRLITEITAGLVMGNLEFMNELLDVAGPTILLTLSELGMSCYLLVLGLEMDPLSLLTRPSREALVAYASVLSTFIVGRILMPYMNLENKDSTSVLIFPLAISLSGTASPILTRLVTDLKMHKSDIGHLVVKAGMHSDMITLLLITLSSIFSEPNKDVPLDLVNITVTLVIFSIQNFILIKIVPILVNWINEKNPEGKSIKGSHLILFLAFMALLCNLGSMIVGYSPIMTAFLVGLSFPRKGRLSKVLNTKINQFLGYVLFPLYFCWIGTLAKFKELNHDDKYIGVKLFFLFVILSIGKVFGTLVASMVLKFHWRDAIAIGLLLNIKGHFHIFGASLSKVENIIGTGSFIVLLFVCIFTIVYIPFVIPLIVKHSEEESTQRRMGLQWLSSSTELRMLVCIHGPQNVPTMINIIEVSRGNMNSKLDVYVTDMIEINDPKFLISEDKLDGTTATMADELVVNMREEITNKILTYVEDSCGEGINVHRLLSISTYVNMHHDLCNLAEAVQASMIILPYHKHLRKDAKTDSVHLGFRHVNRKVLRHAPCSVGILVDRGLGLMNRGLSSSSSSVIHHVAVVFIGGQDDREALSYAVRISKHPGINLTVIRFLQDSHADKPSSKASNKRLLKAMQEEEMKLDDEFFAQFYEKNVAHGKVGYMEKHVSNAKETVATLKALEGQYVLFIVGRGNSVHPITTSIMKDWEECPDLGPTGEILADKDFSVTASVLVIQQHCIDENEDDEFNVT